MTLKVLVSHPWIREQEARKNVTHAREKMAELKMGSVKLLCRISRFSLNNLEVANNTDCALQSKRL